MALRIEPRRADDEEQHLDEHREDAQHEPAGDRARPVWLLRRAARVVANDVHGAHRDDQVEADAHLTLVARHGVLLFLGAAGAGHVAQHCGVLAIGLRVSQPLQPRREVWVRLTLCGPRWQLRRRALQQLVHLRLRMDVCEHHRTGCRRCRRGPAHPYVRCRLLAPSQQARQQLHVLERDAVRVSAAKVA